MSSVDMKAGRRDLSTVIKMGRVAELDKSPQFEDYKSTIVSCFSQPENAHIFRSIGTLMRAYEVTDGCDVLPRAFGTALKYLSQTVKHHVTKKDLFVSSCFKYAGVDTSMVHDIACGRKTAEEVADMLIQQTGGSLRDTVVSNLKRKACRRLAEVAYLHTFIEGDYAGGDMRWASCTRVDYSDSLYDSDPDDNVSEARCSHRNTARDEGDVIRTGRAISPQENSSIIAEAHLFIAAIVQDDHSYSDKTSLLRKRIRNAAGIMGELSFSLAQISKHTLDAVNLLSRQVDQMAAEEEGRNPKKKTKER